MIAEGKKAVAAVVSAAAIAVTPYCGALFGCGCTWPWAGLDRHCNIHDPAAPFHCPWCEYPVAGALSVTLAVIAGAMTAGFIDPKDFRLRTWLRDPRGRILSKRAAALSEILARTLLGVGAFFLIAALAASLTAAVTGFRGSAIWFSIP